MKTGLSYYEDEKIVDQMSEKAYDLIKHVRLIEDCLAGAIDAYTELEFADAPPGLDAESIDGCIDGCIHDMDREFTGTLISLRAFDQDLAKLLELRGKLAEVTGIPMFSHIGEGKRSPARQTYDM